MQNRKLPNKILLILMLLAILTFNTACFAQVLVPLIPRCLIKQTDCLVGENGFYCRLGDTVTATERYGCTTNVMSKRLFCNVINIRNSCRVTLIFPCHHGMWLPIDYYMWQCH